MSSPEPGTSKDKPKSESLKTVMSRKRKELSESPEASSSSGCKLVDPYANSAASKYITKGGTAYVYDRAVLKHKCLWDERYPENPDRVTSIIKKCTELGLLAQCTPIVNLLRTDLREKILTKHTVEHYEKLKNLCQNKDLDFLEREAENYDSVYFNEHTFEAANRALSSTLNLVHAVARGEVQNGMAFVRPPGHHAMNDQFNGYCFFNNVAIAAESCIQENLASKILIVDFDVHHGQGTQRMYYGRKDVLYFSIHRYEHGSFWPYLAESNFHYIGTGEGLGYNINVPLNATELTDDDYLAIVFSILLPVAYEFNPDLVIVSAGYDAAIGCPEGKMRVTPGFYSHLITLLSGVAKGKMAVVLEGGYFCPSLAEGAAMTLKALLGGPCPVLDPLRSVHPSVVETISNVRRILHDKWTCFKSSEIATENSEHQYEICYAGFEEKPPFPTRDCYPKNTAADSAYYSSLTTALGCKYRAENLPVIFAYDEQMLHHAPHAGDRERPEKPERLISIMNIFKDFGLENRLQKIPITVRDFRRYNTHELNYFESIPSMVQTRDVYINEHTQKSVHFAISALMDLIDGVMFGEAGSGIAVIRPPGHHAEYDKPEGFCLMNNVAIGANYLQTKHHLRRILIVDFDIHHGNGTQNMNYETNNVMYISIHKDEDGKFFPANSPRNYTHDGYGPGKGFNINIPFNKDKMGDTEYLAAFHNIVLPAAYAYAPEIVLVSAGFDAGIHDPLGGYNVSPETFGHLIQMLKPLAGGKLILALEGGYNLTTTSYAMGICAKVLLGDPVIMPENVYKEYSNSAAETFRKVADHLKQYHDVFTMYKKLATTPYVVRKLDTVTRWTYDKKMKAALDPERVHDSEYVQGEMNNLN